MCIKKSIFLLLLFLSLRLNACQLLSLFSKKIDPAAVVNEFKVCGQEANAVLILIGTCAQVMPKPILGKYMQEYRERFMDIKIRQLNLYNVLVRAGYKPELNGIFLKQLEQQAAHANFNAFFELVDERELPFELQEHYLDMCEAAYQGVQKRTLVNNQPKSKKK
jgi:hypothetical protein